MFGIVSATSSGSPVLAGTGSVNAAVASIEARRRDGPPLPIGLGNATLPGGRSPQTVPYTAAARRPVSLTTSGIGSRNASDQAVLDVLRAQTRRSTSPTLPVIEGKGTLHSPPPAWDTQAYNSGTGHTSPDGSGAGQQHVGATAFKRSIASISPTGSPPLISSIPTTPIGEGTLASMPCNAATSSHGTDERPDSPTAAGARQFWKQLDSDSRASSRSSSPVPATGPVTTADDARERVAQDIRSSQQRERQWQQQHLSNERWRYEALYQSAFAAVRS